MTVALQGLEKGDFVKPGADSATGETVSVPSCSGMSLNDCRAVLQQAGFGTSVVRVENAKKAGTFLGLSPKSEAPKFSTIKLMVSSGPKAEASAPASAAPATSAPPATGGGTDGNR